MRWLFRYVKIYVIFCCMDCYPVRAQAQDAEEKILLDKIIVTIDKKIILKSELKLACQMCQERESHVLEQMIIDKILLIKAKKEGIVISKEIINDRYKQKIGFLIQNAGSEVELERKLKKPIAIFKKELIKMIQEECLRESLGHQITNKITVSPTEVKNFFNKIPSSERHYYGSSVEVRHLVKYPKISNEDKEAIITQLKSLKKQIETGGDFEILAKVYSEDPITASRGGTMGFVPIGTSIAPAYETAVLSLAPGMISDPIETEYGFHLVQLLEKKSGGYNSRHILIKHKPSTENFKEIETQLNDIRSQILNNEISFEEAVAQYSEDFFTSNMGGLLTRTREGRSLVLKANLPPDLFFTIEKQKMEPGDISPPLLYKGVYEREGRRILFLKQKIIPHQMNLVQDYEDIFNKVIEEKKMAAIQKWVKDIKDEFIIHIDPDYQNYVKSFYESMDKK